MDNTFEELLKKIYPKLRGITYKLNRHSASFNDEDLLQEALIRLWQDFNAGKLSDKTESYILQGCFFHLKNYIRKNYDKAPLVSLEYNVDQEGEAVAADKALPLENPESSFELINCRMLIDKINNNGLSEREKQVFRFSLEGLTTREIGNKLGVSHVMVVKLKGGVREKCRKYLDWR